MLLLIVFILCVAVALGAGILSGWSDYKGLTIPNRYPVIVLLSFIPAYIAGEMAGAGLFLSLKWHLLAMAVIFVLTFIMFLTRTMGGGDSKLMTAYGVWAGMAGLATMLLVMAVLGGVLAFFAIFVRKKKPFRAPAEKSWIGRLQQGESSVPYGIAIAGGAIAAFFELGYFGWDNWQSFL